MHVVPAPGFPGVATPLTGATIVRHGLFLAFFGFLLLVLNCLVDNDAVDVTLIPRLLAVLVFLLVAVVVVSMRPIIRMLDCSSLGEPLIPLFAGYLLVTCGSLLFAANVSAGYTDVFRTLATFLTLCLSCLLLPIVPRWQEQLLRVLVVAGLVAAAVGYHEIVTKLGIGIHDRRGMEQITGLMSSVNLYAGMLALLLPWCLCGAVLLGGTWRVLAVLGTILILVIVVLLQSRAAWLAVLAGTTVAVGMLLVWPATFDLSRRTYQGLLIACLAGVVVLAGGIALAPEGNVFARRFRSIFMEPAGPAALPREGGRLMIWKITARMIADHPLGGVGAGNFAVRLHEYFGADDLDFSNVPTNWLQPHNDFLWVCVEKGIPGLLLFAGCFVVAFVRLAAVLRSDASSRDRWLALAAMMGLTSYVTLSCFDFPLERINHQIHLALLFAVAVVLSHSVRPMAGGFPKHVDAVRGRLVVTSAIATALCLGIAYSLAAVRQEKDVIAARYACRQGRWDEMLAAARRAHTPWKTLDPWMSPVAFLEGMAHVRMGHVEEGIACMEQARIENPNRMYVVNNLGILYASVGRFDEAIECFSLTADRYPHRIEPFNNLASCLLEIGHPVDAVAILEQIPDALRTDGMRRNLELARAQAADQVAEPEQETEEETEEEVTAPASP